MGKLRPLVAEKHLHEGVYPWPRRGGCFKHRAA